MVRLKTVLDNHCLELAPHHTHAGSFPTGKRFYTAKPTTMHRILAKDTLEKYMKNNIITRWGEVTSGPNGVVTHRDVPTFIEGFIEIPPLLYMLQLRHTKMR